MEIMRHMVMFILMLICMAGFAQDDSIEPPDSVAVELAPDFQVYLGASYILNQFAGTGASFGAIQAGMLFKDRLDVNVYYSGIFDDFHLTIIFPEEFSFNQQNYGVSANYKFLNGSIRPIAGFGYQYAVASWNPESDSKETFTDNIHVFSINVGVGWQIVPVFRVEAKAGYNFAQDVDIIGLQSDDFDGYKMEIGAKMRIFAF